MSTDSPKTEDLVCLLRGAAALALKEQPIRSSVLDSLERAHGAVVRHQLTGKVVHWQIARLLISELMAEVGR